MLCHFDRTPSRNLEISGCLRRRRDELNQGQGFRFSALRIPVGEAALGEAQRCLADCLLTGTEPSEMSNA
jgi:hypothetical protein